MTATYAAVSEFSDQPESIKALVNRTADKRGYERDVREATRRRLKIWSESHGGRLRGHSPEIRGGFPT